AAQGEDEMVVFNLAFEFGAGNPVPDGPALGVDADDLAHAEACGSEEVADADDGVARFQAADAGLDKQGIENKVVALVEEKHVGLGRGAFERAGGVGARESAAQDDDAMAHGSVHPSGTPRMVSAEARARARPAPVSVGSL